MPDDPEVERERLQEPSLQPAEPLPETLLPPKPVVVRLLSQLRSAQPAVPSVVDDRPSGPDRDPDRLHDPSAQEPDALDDADEFGPVTLFVRSQAQAPPDTALHTTTTDDKATSRGLMGDVPELSEA